MEEGKVGIDENRTDRKKRENYSLERLIMDLSRISSVRPMGWRWLKLAIMGFPSPLLTEGWLGSRTSAGAHFHVRSVPAAIATFPSININTTIPQTSDSGSHSLFQPDNFPKLQRVRVLIDRG